MAADALNRIRLTGELATIEPLRHTPAGLPVINVKLAHRSLQREADIERQAEFEVNAVAVGEVTAALSGYQPGDRLTVQGFLSARRRSGLPVRTQAGAQLVLHITHIIQKT